MTMLSPLAAAVAELSAASAVTAITTRIRPIEPAAGDALGAGNWQPFVVVSVIDDPWSAGTATATATLGLACYGATYAQAEALYLACASVFHRKGGRIAASRLGIYSSTVQGGGTPDSDPSTRQPLFRGLVNLNVSTQPIPA